MPSACGSSLLEPARSVPLGVALSRAPRARPALVQALRRRTRRIVSSIQKRSLAAQRTRLLSTSDWSVSRPVSQISLRGRRDVQPLRRRRRAARRARCSSSSRRSYDQSIVALQRLLAADRRRGRRAAGRAAAPAARRAASGRARSARAAASSIASGRLSSRCEPRAPRPRALGRNARARCRRARPRQARRAAARSTRSRRGRAVVHGSSRGGAGSGTTRPAAASSGAAFDHLLEVVEQQEQLALADVPRKLLLRPEALRDRLGHEGGIAQRRETDPEDTVAMLGDELCGRRLRVPDGSCRFRRDPTASPAGRRRGASHSTSASSRSRPTNARRRARGGWCW